jgi:SAM-dependent methyltransferase
MGLLYDFYERRVFPHVLDRAMRGMGDHRGPTLQAARGDVLEIGFGTGLNLRYYPEGVRQLSTVDPMDALPEKVEERIAAAPFPVARHHLPADGALPFDSGRFDTVTITWTLCTIPDPVRALAEMRRVAKPDAKLLFIEHGRSDEPDVARWQERLNPAWNVIGCGCNLNRPIDELIPKGGFAIQHLERFVDGPKIFASLYRGVATPA